jgi:putative DNA primase/helicase
MRKSQSSQPKTTIELTKQGVFQISSTPAGGPKRKKIAAPIRLRAIGKKADGATIAQIRFRTMHGDYRSEFFAMSDLLPKNRDEIKNKLADLGYEWPEDGDLTSSILQKVATTRPKREFLMVSAPGWYEPAFVIPGKVFASGTNKPEIYIDPNSDAHVGAFVLGEGSLKDWQELVAKPSRQSSCLRLSIAAALGAPFLRPLGLDSFGINWFSDTSDGKSHAVFAAASVAGLMGPAGLPSWADSEPAIEDQARGLRDCVMPLDETADGEDKNTPLEKKARILAFLIARNRPRRLSRIYERNNNLENREFRIIVVSTSERALGQIARAAGRQRLGGEEVRFIDIPASDPNSAGIFDGKITPAPGKTLRETTKELIDTLEVNAIKHQGYAFCELMEKYINDQHGLERVKT